jgi:cytochrome P450
MTKTIKDLPGPKGYPFVGMLPKVNLPDLHNQIQKWAEDYGDVFRLDLGLTEQMVVARPSIIQKLLASRPKEFNRSKKLDRVIREATVNGVFNAEGEDWKLHRSLVAKGLDVKHQKSFYPAMALPLERLYNKWSKNADDEAPFNIQKDLLRFTVDVTSSLAFGYPMNTIEQEGGVIQDHMDKIFPTMFKRINSPIPWYHYFKSKDDRVFDKAVLEMNKLIDTFIEKGKKEIENDPSLINNPENVLQSFLVAAEQDDKITNEHVKGNLLTLLMAGEDTTAHTLAWMIVLLTEQPKVCTEIAEEADSILNDECWATKYESNAQLKHIEAVAFESMRLKPVAPAMLFETTEDLEIEGYFFKKGQKVLTHHRYGAVNDAYFSDAKTFNADRWKKESRCPVHNTDAYTPFGGGPRYCPGRNLALLEIKMVIAMLFKNFEIEMETNHKDIKEIMAFTMMSSEFQVKLKHRNK